ncbi:hypothetical protein GCM10023196_094470 [Actinoallomurus vinaceus]|uniref:Glycosyltransferase n=1 Tax=Actinoallomurus vinaceus TaxID=1080074 RepID=A0ABP8UTJ4_9ACTN
MTTLLVIAKEPVPGRVKTRLTPPYTPEQAAALAEAALADTLAAVAATPAARRVLVLAGRPGPWLPEGFEVIPQRGGGLDERLANAFADADGPAVLVGMDTPQVAPAALTRAVRSLEDGDAVFGPAADGGFWLIGLREPDPRLFLGVPMSRPDTGAHQRARLRGMRVTTLDTLTDVDTADDAVRVAAQAPGTRFAAALTALTAPRPGNGRSSARPSGQGGRKDERRSGPPDGRANGCTPAPTNSPDDRTNDHTPAPTDCPDDRTDGRIPAPARPAALSARPREAAQ